MIWWFYCFETKIPSLKIFPEGEENFLLFTKKIIDARSWPKKNYRTTECWWRFSSTFLKVVGFGFCYFSLIFSEVIVLVFSRKMLTYIFAWYKMYPRMLVWRTTECWSTNRQKHTNSEKMITIWDSMICLLKVVTAVYSWTLFALSRMI